jgi:hypothetical protein
VDETNVCTRDCRQGPGGKTHAGCL